MHTTTAEMLQNSLQTKLPPIALAFAEEVPDSIPFYSKREAAGCMFWQRAAEGTFATTTQDHELCSIGVYTHNLKNPSESYAGELGNVLGVLGELDYVREEDIPKIPKLERSPTYVVYGPLNEFPLEPDVVMLFVHSQQSLVVTEAVQQIDPEVPLAMGRPACAVVPQAFNQGKAALSLGCCGARAYLDTLTDDIALWALPGAKVTEYAERIAKLAHANQVLSQFHQLRKQDVAAGKAPTYAESMARMSQ